MRTIDKIITKVNCKYGAPMGRSNVIPSPMTIYDHGGVLKVNGKRVFDCWVPMNGAYDKGGAYWGLPANLRVKYTKDLSYVEFYRTDNKH